MPLSRKELQLIRRILSENLVESSTIQRLKNIKTKREKQDNPTSIDDLLTEKNILPRSQIQTLLENIESSDQPQSDSKPGKTTKKEPNPERPSPDNDRRNRPRGGIHQRRPRTRRSFSSGNKPDDSNQNDKGTNEAPSSGNDSRPNKSSPSFPSRRSKSLRSRRRAPKSPNSAGSSDSTGTGKSVPTSSPRRRSYSRQTNRRKRLQDAKSRLKREGTDPEEAIPGYLINDIIAKGGEGAVFHTTKKGTDEEYALKVLFPAFSDEEIVVDRFMREGRYLGKLDHPNILKNVHYGKYEDIHYQVLELVKGKNGLQKIEDEGPLEEDLALEIIAKISMALQYMKKNDLIHRDVKPGNIMISAAGEIKLFDLGLARELGSNPDLENGLTLGTVEYMSPEQARDLDGIDIRSDLYALGISLYQFVTGSLPFTGESPREILAKQVDEPLSDEKFEEYSVGSTTKSFIQKLTRKDPDQRYQTPLDVAREIKGLI